MKNLLVLIPETSLIKYFVYRYNEMSSSKKNGDEKLIYKGKVKFISADISNDEINKLLTNFNPDLIAIRVLYGGNDLRETEFYDSSIHKEIEKLITKSPLHISIVLKLLKFLDKSIPRREILLFFETAFFINLPVQEQLYALDTSLINANIRRFGYHGLFHRAGIERINKENRDASKIISICLEPVPEIAAIYNDKPVMVTSGSTPLEGIPGNTNSGEIDPGIILQLEAKKRLGPEMINEILTKKSGLSAIVGKSVSIGNILSNGNRYEPAKAIFQYHILLSCGSCIAVMNGVDAVVFSGKYIDAARNLAEWLIPRLVAAGTQKIVPKLFYLQEALSQIIAHRALSYFENVNNYPPSKL